MSTSTPGVPAQASRPGRRRREALVGGVIGVGALAAATLVAVVDPNQPGHYPTCPVLALTGFWCPGCGGLRATHDLLHLDVAGALARNPLVVLGALWLTVLGVALVLRRLGISAPLPVSNRPVVVNTLLVLLAVFAVARNLPGWTWLSPA